MTIQGQNNKYHRIKKDSRDKREDPTWYPRLIIIALARMASDRWGTWFKRGGTRYLILGVTIHSSSNFFLSDGRGRYGGRSDGPRSIKQPDPMARNPKSLRSGLRSFYSYFWMDLFLDFWMDHRINMFLRGFNCPGYHSLEMTIQGQSH